MMGNFDWFPTRRWQIVSRVTVVVVVVEWWVKVYWVVWFGGFGDVVWSENPGVVDLSWWSSSFGWWCLDGVCGRFWLDGWFPFRFGAQPASRLVFRMWVGGGGNFQDRF